MLKHKDFKTNDGESEEIYAVTRWCNIEEEGPSNQFFDTDNVERRGGSFVSENGETLEVPVIVEQINTRGFTEGDIVSLERQVDIDDNNALGPENIPTPSNDNGNQIFYWQGYDRFVSVVKLAVKTMKHFFLISADQFYKLLRYFFPKYMLKK